jgi:hypothetical protein
VYRLDECDLVIDIALFSYSFMRVVVLIEHLFIMDEYDGFIDVDIDRFG